jgi:hypothetical protein
MIIISMILVSTNLFMAWHEFQPFLDAIQIEMEMTRNAMEKLTLVFRLIRHLPKLIPTAADLAAMSLFGGIFGFNTGLIGAMGGLMASNILSLCIWNYRRELIKRRLKIEARQTC